MARVREAVLNARTTAWTSCSSPAGSSIGANRLRAEKHLGDLELLESREKLYDVRDDLNKGESRLAELELDGVTAENARKRAQLERRLKIGELETRLKLDRDKLERTSRVVSPARGQVAAGAEPRWAGWSRKVRRWSCCTRPGPSAAPTTPASAYDAIVFVSAGEGKRIEAGDPVEVVPATVKREEHGFIRGRVVAIAELPATKLAMEAALEHPELVEAFLKRYAPGVVLRVQIKLDEQRGGGRRNARAGVDPRGRTRSAGRRRPGRRSRSRPGRCARRRSSSSVAR